MKDMLSEDKMFVKVLKTNDIWYGMIYHEDVAVVKDSFQKMLENGVYCEAANCQWRKLHDRIGSFPF